MKNALLCVTSALVLAWASSAHAQAPTAGNLEKLSDFKTTGTPMDIPQVPQTGAKADAIKKNLAQHQAAARLQDRALRHRARRAPHGGRAARRGDVRRHAQEQGVRGDRPRHGSRGRRGQGVRALDHLQHSQRGVLLADGFLFIAEQNRVLVFPAAEFFYEGPDVAAFVVVKQGELIPPEEESYNHTARVCRIGPDDKLYITLGQPFNVYAPEKMEPYQKSGIGGIVRMSRDGKDRDVFATGVRNSVGMDFNPRDRTLWFTDNQVDGMGDNQPPGELNRADKAGMNFGFPYFGGGKTRTNEYKNQTPPADVTYPQVEMDAHAADLGMTFYNGRMFPYRPRSRRLLFPKAV